jgi:hypothetical protein
MGPAHAFACDAFAGLAVAAKVAPAAGIGTGGPCGAGPEHEAADKHAGTRGNA